MARPKTRTEPSVIVATRFEPEDVALLDEVRGGEDRSALIRTIVTRELKKLQHKNKAR